MAQPKLRFAGTLRICAILPANLRSGGDSNAMDPCRRIRSTSALPALTAGAGSNWFMTRETGGWREGGMGDQKAGPEGRTFVFFCSKPLAGGKRKLTF